MEACEFLADSVARAHRVSFQAAATNIDIRGGQVLTMRGYVSESVPIKLEQLGSYESANPLPVTTGGIYTEPDQLLVFG